MTTANNNFPQYTGKRVTLTLKPTGDDTENEVIEGKVEIGVPQGLMFKAKGKGQPDLIEADRIVDVVEIPDKPKELKAKSLKLVDAAGAKAHLLERHGITLDWVNAASDSDAATYHDSVNHAPEVGKLGHVHAADKPKTTPAEDAIDAAAGNEASS